MIDIKTNPTITISENDIETLKNICSLALEYISEAKIDLGSSSLNEIAKELNLKTIDYSLVIKMIGLIKEA